MKNYENYLTTYNGRELLKKHAPVEYGIWQVYGEDPNCDWGGPHHEPNMGVYEGKLEDILTLVTSMPMFWTWGAGGRIVKTNVEKIDPATVVDRNNKRERLKQLEKEIEVLKKDLGTKF